MSSTATVPSLLIQGHYRQLPNPPPKSPSYPSVSEKQSRPLQSGRSIYIVPRPSRVPPKFPSKIPTFLPNFIQISSMVSSMMRWRPWPPPPARKFEVRLIVRRADGLAAAAAAGVEVVWKGPRAALRRRATRRNVTREVGVGECGAVEWEEDFASDCGMAVVKDGSGGGFCPWDVAFTVFSAVGSNQGSKSKPVAIGTASLNLAEFVSSSQGREVEISLPLLVPGGSTESCPSLHLALSLVELRSSNESLETGQRSIVPIPSPPPSKDGTSSEKDELSKLKAGLRKVKLLTEFVSARKAKKASQEENGSEGRCSDRCEDAEFTSPFDSDSHDDDLDEGELDDEKENSFRKSFSYGTLSSANYLGGSFYADLQIDGEYEDLVYYSHRRSDVGCPHGDEGIVTKSSVQEQVSSNSSKRSILPWKKRKLSFRSPKAKGEPLLKKAYGEEGGDDIDYDRRQLSSSDESHTIEKNKVDDLAGNSPSISDFGDDNFAIGSWESKEVLSRDGHMKLCTDVFFASIDQRSERAAGESACTALVAVITDWFQSNMDMMPIKSQFDSLIREGSLEWRNLCENQTYRERFPDKHFDLDTVIEAKIRPLSEVQRKSFIGFFHPEGIEEDSSGFDFLHGAMSFDSIWDEISQADGSPRLYVVSWNDHFFVLKVERDAYYIVDTLGERLHEGCEQAYILKFDESTSIHRIAGSDKATSSDSASNGSQQVQQNADPKEGSPARQLEGVGSPVEDHQLVCRGKDSCKEYIKGFLAAIPVRELQADIKKGRVASTPLHHRLQIEFHFMSSTRETQTVETLSEYSRPEEPVAITITVEAPSECSGPEEPVASTSTMDVADTGDPLSAVNLLVENV